MPPRLPTEERQAEIVAAALRLAAVTNPGQITTAEIAATVGISQGAVFKHFPTKEAIWLAAMQGVRQNLLQRLQTAADQAPSPLAALAAMFAAHVEFVIAQPGVPRVIFHELQHPADSAIKQAVRALLQDYRQLLLACLHQAAAQQLIDRGLNKEAAATSFIGLIQGLVMQSMLTGHSHAMRQQADAVWTLYQRSLGVSLQAPEENT